MMFMILVSWMALLGVRVLSDPPPPPPPLIALPIDGTAPPTENDDVSLGLNNPYPDDDEPGEDENDTSNDQGYTYDDDDNVNGSGDDYYYTDDDYTYGQGAEVSFYHEWLATNLSVNTCTTCDSFQNIVMDAYIDTIASYDLSKPPDGTVIELVVSDVHDVETQYMYTAMHEHSPSAYVDNDDHDKDGGDDWAWSFEPFATFEREADTIHVASVNDFGSVHQERTRLHERADYIRFIHELNRGYKRQDDSTRVGSIRAEVVVTGDASSAALAEIGVFLEQVDGSIDASAGTGTDDVYTRVSTRFTAFATADDPDAAFDSAVTVFAARLEERLRRSFAQEPDLPGAEWVVVCRGIGDVRCLEVAVDVGTLRDDDWTDDADDDTVQNEGSSSDLVDGSAVTHTGIADALCSGTVYGADDEWHTIFGGSPYLIWFCVLAFAWCTCLGAGVWLHVRATCQPTSTVGKLLTAPRLHAVNSLICLSTLRLLYFLLCLVVAFLLAHASGEYDSSSPMLQEYLPCPDLIFGGEPYLSTWGLPLRILYTAPFPLVLRTVTRLLLQTSTFIAHASEVTVLVSIFALFVALGAYQGACRVSIEACRACQLTSTFAVLAAVASNGPQSWRLADRVDRLWRSRRRLHTSPSEGSVSGSGVELHMYSHVTRENRADDDSTETLVQLQKSQILDDLDSVYSRISERDAVAALPRYTAAGVWGAVVAAAAAFVLALPLPGIGVEFTSDDTMLSRGFLAASVVFALHTVLVPCGELALAVCLAYGVWRDVRWPVVSAPIAAKHGWGDEEGAWGVEELTPLSPNIELRKEREECYPKRCTRGAHHMRNSDRSIPHRVPIPSKSTRASARAHAPTPTTATIPASLSRSKSKNRSRAETGLEASISTSPCSSTSRSQSQSQSPSRLPSLSSSSLPQPRALLPSSVLPHLPHGMVPRRQDEHLYASLTPPPQQQQHKQRSSKSRSRRERNSAAHRIVMPVETDD